jgi:hypothetical protein
MKLTPYLIATIYILISCNSQTVTPTSPPTEPPQPSATATIAPTETPLPTETPSPISTSNDIFGAIPLNSVQAFTIEPVAQAIFEKTLQGFVTAGIIQEYRVDSVAVFPSGEGGLIAEIYYSLHTNTDPWPEDFGTASADGWITGKCSRFDLVATETEHQLKNKRLCS